MSLLAHCFSGFSFRGFGSEAGNDFADGGGGGGRGTRGKPAMMMRGEETEGREEKRRLLRGGEKRAGFDDLDRHSKLSYINV